MYACVKVDEWTDCETKCRVRGHTCLRPNDSLYRPEAKNRGDDVGKLGIKTSSWFWLLDLVGGSGGWIWWVDLVGGSEFTPGFNVLHVRAPLISGGWVCHGTQGSMYHVIQCTVFDRLPGEMYTVETNVPDSKLCFMTGICEPPYGHLPSDRVHKCENPCTEGFVQVLCTVYIDDSYDSDDYQSGDAADKPRPGSNTNPFSAVGPESAITELESFVVKFNTVVRALVDAAKSVERRAGEEKNEVRVQEEKKNSLWNQANLIKRNLLISS
ncbi:hypothetical protein Btru_078075 [Bulinus truncatus]|nr:hypothetical protein Btru_078075 [Bulinus truncatus]